MKKMNKTIEVLTRVCLPLLLVVSLLSIDACAQTDQNKATGKTDAVAAQDAPALKDRKEKLSYALGMALGNQFRARSVEVDLDLYVRGLEDALSGGETLMTEKEARATVMALQRELERKRTAKQDAVAADIIISFKLDPRLTRAQYMGDRWVSPPTYTSTLQVGTELTVEARAQGFDAGGRRVPITPKWMPADPEMVTVVPNRGKEVKIIVKRAGQTSLKVVSREFTKELHIKAMDRGNNAMQVEISQ